jgi:hypothetical protein
VWGRDGRTLYYWQGEQLVAADVRPDGAGGALRVRARTPLFRASYAVHINPNYDVSPDGARFALVTAAERANRLVVALGALGALGALAGR